MDTRQHQQADGGIGGWLYSRTGAATAVAIMILGFLIYKGHTAHLLGALPFLILSCPLLHIFMHGGHGHHERGQKPKPDQEDDPGGSPQHKH